MTSAVSTNLSLGKLPGVGVTPGQEAVRSADASSFSDLLKSSIEEVSRMQQDASKAVEDLTTGRTEDVTGVMMAMEKSDLAFKTLLAIRAKLMDAYEEIKTLQV